MTCSECGYSSDAEGAIGPDGFCGECAWTRDHPEEPDHDPECPGYYLYGDEERPCPECRAANRERMAEERFEYEHEEGR